MHPMYYGMYRRHGSPGRDGLGYGRLSRTPSPRRGRGRKKRKRNRSKRVQRCMKDPPAKVGGDTWELSREDTGLKLVGELAPPGTKWVYKMCDESRRCYVGFLHAPVPRDRLASFYEQIRDGTDWQQPIDHRGLEIPRKTAWMVAQGCECKYRYGGIEVRAQSFPAWMFEILSIYMPYCGFEDRAHWPDSCNVNLYDNGLSSVGWHSDDEVLFQGLNRDIRILSLSLGQSRKFQIKKNWPEEDELESDKVVLHDGALCTMEGMFQKHYMHRVPKEREGEELGPRINLTWRWIVQHSKACPLCR